MEKLWGRQMNYELSDAGNVERFIDRYGDSVRFCPGRPEEDNLRSNFRVGPAQAKFNLLYIGHYYT